MDVLTFLILLILLAPFHIWIFFILRFSRDRILILETSLLSIINAFVDILRSINDIFKYNPSATTHAKFTSDANSVRRYVHKHIPLKKFNLDEFFDKTLDMVVNEYSNDQKSRDVLPAGKRMVYGALSGISRFT